MKLVLARHYLFFAQKIKTAVNYSNINAVFRKSINLHLKLFRQPQIVIIQERDIITVGTLCSTIASNSPTKRLVIPQTQHSIAKSVFQKRSQWHIGTIVNHNYLYVIVGLINNAH